MRKTILALLAILVVSTLVLTGCKSEKAATDANDQKATQTEPAKQSHPEVEKAAVKRAQAWLVLVDAEKNGMAIQSMRSVAYAHLGEQMPYLGCHEQKHRASNQPARKSLALQRPPSKIKGDVDGSNPFNYVRLVQPVLERNCAACRQEKKTLDLAGVIEGKDG